MWGASFGDLAGWVISSLLLLADSLSPRAWVPVSVSSMGQIDLFKNFCTLLDSEQKKRFSQEKATQKM